MSQPPNYQESQAYPLPLKIETRIPIAVPIALLGLGLLFMTGLILPTENDPFLKQLTINVGLPLMGLGFLVLSVLGFRKRGSTFMINDQTFESDSLWGRKRFAWDEIADVDYAQIGGQPAIALVGVEELRKQQTPVLGLIRRIFNEDGVAAYIPLINLHDLDPDRIVATINKALESKTASATALEAHRMNTDPSERARKKTLLRIVAIGLFVALTAVRFFYAYQSRDPQRAESRRREWSSPAMSFSMIFPSQWGTLHDSSEGDHLVLRFGKKREAIQIIPFQPGNIEFIKGYSGRRIITLNSGVQATLISGCLGDEQVYELVFNPADAATKSALPAAALEPLQNHIVFRVPLWNSFEEEQPFIKALQTLEFSSTGH